MRIPGPCLGWNEWGNGSSVSSQLTRKGEFLHRNEILQFCSNWGRLFTKIHLHVPLLILLHHLDRLIQPLQAGGRLQFSRPFVLSSLSSLFLYKMGPNVSTELCRLEISTSNPVKAFRRRWIIPRWMDDTKKVVELWRNRLRLSPPPGSYWKLLSSLLAGWGDEKQRRGEDQNWFNGISSGLDAMLWLPLTSATTPHSGQGDERRRWG